MKVYPEYNWLPWKFVSCPKNFWHNVKNQRNFMDWASTQLNVKDMNDWYKVTKKVRNQFYYIQVEKLGNC
jgi:hypothetical protein